MLKGKLYITFCIVTAYVHGAADELRSALIIPAKPAMHDFIGFASDKAGSCLIATPDQIEPGKNFPITMVYAKTPELLNQERLAKFAASFAAIKPEFSKARFDAALLQAISDCNIETIVPTMNPVQKIQMENAQQQIDSMRQLAEMLDSVEDRKRCDVLQQKLDETRKLIEEEYRGSDSQKNATAEVKLDAIILFVTLSETGLHSFQSNSGYEIQSGKIRYSSFERPLVEPFTQPYHNEKSNKDMKYVYWAAHCHQQDIYDNDLPGSPQEFAERYVRGARYSKYNLVIDITKFKERLATARSAASAEEQS